MKFMMRWAVIGLAVILFAVYPRGLLPSNGHTDVVQPITTFNWMNLWQHIQLTIYEIHHNTSLAGTSISSLVTSNFQVSIGILLLAFSIMLVVGVSKGLYDGARADVATVPSRLSGGIHFVLESFPDFFLICAMYLVSYLLLIHFHIEIGFGGDSGFWTGTFVPALVVAILPTLYMARVVRRAVEEQSGQQYLTTAQSKGLTLAQIFFKHVFPNTYSAILSAIFPAFAMMFSSLLMVDLLFLKYGIGYGIYSSIGEIFGEIVYTPLSVGLHTAAFRLADPALLLANLAAAGLFFLMVWVCVKVTLRLLGYRGVSNDYTSAFRDRSKGTGRLALFSGGSMLLALMLLGAFQRLLHLHNPDQEQVMIQTSGTNFAFPPYSPMTFHYLFGSDKFGHDLLSRAIAGIFPTLEYVALISGILVVAAIVLALLASQWNFRPARWFIQILNGIFAVVPGLIACLFIFDTPDMFWAGSTTVATLPGMADEILWNWKHTALFIAVICLVEVGRVSAHFLHTLDDLNQKTYMDAAEISGCSAWDKLIRHNLNPFLSTVIEQLVVSASRVLILISSLGFFNHTLRQHWVVPDPLNVDKDIQAHVAVGYDWPSLIAQTAHDWFRIPWVSFAPALFITFTVVSLNLMARGIQIHMRTERKVKTKRMKASGCETASERSSVSTSF